MLLLTQYQEDKFIRITKAKQSFLFAGLNMGMLALFVNVPIQVIILRFASGKMFLLVSSSSGQVPYAALGGQEIVKTLKNGERLQKPEGCSDEMYVKILFFLIFILFYVPFTSFSSLTSAYLLSDVQMNQEI